MTEEAEVVVERDVVYAEGARPLRWDIVRPASLATPAPAVLLYHGGGWRAGDRTKMAAACMEFARLGYVAIAPEYRLLGEAPWPAPLTDARTAIRAARARATALGILPDGIFLTGYSAGAQLALIAASGIAGPSSADEAYADQPEKAAGVAAFFTPTRMEPKHGAALAAMSPIAYADRYPPTILFCGDADSITPPALSVELYHAIRRAGGVADLRLYCGLIHEFVSLPGMMQTTIRDAAAFFARTALQKPEFDEALKKLHQWWQQMAAG